MEWEPRDFTGSNLGYALRDLSKSPHGCRNVVLLEVAGEVNVDVDELLIPLNFGWPARDSGHVDVVAVKDLQAFVK